MNTSVTEQERNWAAVAHASSLLSVLVGILTGGLGALLLALIPLGIYFAHREKSRYVAYHALQATTFQLIALILYAVGLIVLLIVTVVGWIVVGLLLVVLVGVLLIPVALAITLLLILFVLLYPLAAMVYALYGAVQTGRGADFQYHIIGEWLLDIEASWSRAS